MNNPITSQDWQALYQSILENKASIIASGKKQEKAQDKSLRQLDKLKKAQEKTDRQMAKTDKQMAETDKKMAKTDRQIAKTDRQIAKTEKQINKVFKMVGGHLNNVGKVTEEFFFRGLKRKKRLGSVKFDVVRRNVGSAKEYDIIMVNGDSVAVVSVKYKLHLEDIDNFAKKDLKDFKKYFPEFKNYKVYAGIASKFISEDLSKMITEAGLFAISQSGKEIQVLNEGQLQAKVF